MSFVIGALCVACVVLLLGAGSPREPQAGRYQLVFTPDNQPRRLLLDTATGQFWDRSYGDKVIDYGSPGKPTAAKSPLTQYNTPASGGSRPASVLTLAKEGIIKVR